MRRLVFFFLLVAALPVMAQADKDHNFKVAKNLETFNTIYKYLDMMYVDTLDADEVVGNGIRSMLRSLDPYTEYYPEDKSGDLKRMLTGKYAGIGAIIAHSFEDNCTVIEEPYANTPAAEAGLKKGDIILAIDDSTMVGKDNAYVSSHLKGEAGTTIVLKIKRPTTGKTMKMKITRRAIQLPVALQYYGMLPGNVAYINLYEFTEGIAKDVRKAYIDLRKRGAKSLILDLRNNGGGAVNEAASIINMFVPKGITLVKTIGKLKRTNNEYVTSVEPIDTVMPIVVLVNGNTASSSEITCGSLQDLDRAVVMGTRTYGKGLVQMTMDLPYNGNMKLTTAKYYIPSGRCIQAINYKHANGGYTVHVPDSLTKVFHTLHGREVRDGGGIKPDVEVKPDTMSNIAMYLQGADSTSSMRNYAVEYIAKHPTIASPADFELSDGDYEAFKQRVVKSKFNYYPQSRKYMEDLEKLIKFEGYYDDARQEFEALKKKLRHNVAKDLDYHKEDISQMLASDIVAAYYYQAGSIEYSLKHDKQVKAALELLANPERYNGILRGEKTAK